MKKKVNNNITVMELYKTKNKKQKTITIKNKNYGKMD